MGDQREDLYAARVASSAEVPTPGTLHQMVRGQQSVTAADKARLRDLLMNHAEQMEGYGCTIAATLLTSPRPALVAYMQSRGWSMEFMDDQRDGAFWRIQYKGGPGAKEER